MELTLKLPHNRLAFIVLEGTMHNIREKKSIFNLFRSELSELQ